MMIGNPDATTCFEYNRNSARERFRNPNLDLIAITDPCFSGNLRIELQSAREDEVRGLRNDAQSRLPDQEFFETRRYWVTDQIAWMADRHQWENLHSIGVVDVCRAGHQPPDCCRRQSPVDPTR